MQEIFSRDGQIFALFPNIAQSVKYITLRGVWIVLCGESYLASK